MVQILVLGLLFGLLAIGTPVGFAMAFSGSIGLLIVGGPSALFGILQTAPLSTVSSYELITIPMFLLMADLVLLSGVADDLFQTASAWVGRIPGGLGMATALAGAGFGADRGEARPRHAVAVQTRPGSGLPRRKRFETGHRRRPRTARGPPSGGTSGW